MTHEGGGLGDEPAYKVIVRVRSFWRDYNKILVANDLLSKGFLLLSQPMLICSV